MTKVNVAINGVGRIGKNILRRFFEKEYKNLNLVAINFGSNNIDSKIHSLKYDSIHGIFNDISEVQGDKIFVRKKLIHVIKENNIQHINWKKYNIDIILECSGHFNTKALAYQHIDMGAKKVLVSAPCKNADNMVVLGVNHKSLSPNDIIVSIGSCTTNCLAPILDIISRNFGLYSAFMTSIHSYTNDQRIIDGSHKDLRRSRAAGISIIPTTTGAARSIGAIIPSLRGKIDGAAVRIPTPNVSMIDLTFTSVQNVSVDNINNLIRENAKTNYKEIISVNENYLVSTDFNHTTYSAIIDSNETRVVNKNFGRIAAWYDNEWAFSCRMLEVASLMALYIK